MTQESYCSYEVAKLLKKKGLNTDWIRGAKPTHQFAIRWLREEKYILLFILPAEDRAGNLAYSGAIFTWDEENGIYSPSWESKTYPVYEQAVEASLKYILEFLI